MTNFYEEHDNTIETFGGVMGNTSIRVSGWRQFQSSRALCEHSEHNLTQGLALEKDKVLGRFWHAGYYPPPPPASPS